VVLWRLATASPQQDLSETFLQRGIVFRHATVSGWETKLTPILADELRQRRRGKGGRRSRHWHVDETYRKLRGRGACLYRAIDRDGRLIDTMLSERRDIVAAQAFFRSAKLVTAQLPDRVITDGHGSYPRTRHTTLDRRVVHRTSAFRNNGFKQDHQGVKGRPRRIRRFKSFALAERFCRGYDERRNFLRPLNHHNLFPTTAIACGISAVPTTRSQSSWPLRLKASAGVWR
jgi:putative transposase